MTTARTRINKTTTAPPANKTARLAFTVTSFIEFELKLKDERGFNFYIKKIFNGVEILNEKELGLFNQIKYMVKGGINQLYIDTEENLVEILKIYRDILDDKVPKVSKIKKNYVLGWSRHGVI